MGQPNQYQLCYAASRKASQALVAAKIKEKEIERGEAVKAGNFEKVKELEILIDNWVERLSEM